jgi:hypothetical protein
MPDFNTSHFIMHLQKVENDAERANGDLKSLVRTILYVSENSAPKELRGLRMFTYVNLALRAHKKKKGYSPEEFGEVVRAYAAIDKIRADTLSHNKTLSP